MRVGDLIKQKRLENGYTLTELAKKVGVAHTTVIRWERGDTRSLKNDKIKLLAPILGLSPLDLLDGATEKETSILYKLRSLPQEDKEEIIALIDLKLSRRKNIF